jgi:hypothetical protein
VADDPVKDVRCTPSAVDSLLVTVTIELAEHVAQCCVNPEAAFVEFIGEGHHVKTNFHLCDHRPGYLMEATVNLPAPGSYSYRIAAKILDRTLMREGTYIANSIY